MHQNQKVDRIFRSGMILYSAYFIASVIYGVVMVGFAMTGWAGMLDDPGVAAWLVPVAFTALAVVIVLTREIWTAKVFNQAINTGGTVVDGLSAAHVLRLLLNEAIAVMGLASYLMLGNIFLAAPFVAVGIAALYRSRPDKGQWLERSSS